MATRRLLVVFATGCLVLASGCDEEIDPPTSVCGNLQDPACAASVSARLTTLRNHLHAGPGTGTEALRIFPDLTHVFTDAGHGNPNLPSTVLPYKYYWSAEGSFTVSICALDYTVFICPYRVDYLITPGEFSKCTVDSGYAQAENAFPR